MKNLFCLMVVLIFFVETGQAFTVPSDDGEKTVVLVGNDVSFDQVFFIPDHFTEVIVISDENVLAKREFAPALLTNQQALLEDVVYLPTAPPWGNSSLFYKNMHKIKTAKPSLFKSNNLTPCIRDKI